MIGAAWFAIMVIVIGGPCALIASDPRPSSHGSWTSASSGKERSCRRRRRERESGSEWASGTSRALRGRERDSRTLRTAARSRVLARCVRHFTRTHSNWRAISPTVSPCRRVSLSAHSISARYAADPLCDAPAVAVAGAAAAAFVAASSGRGGWWMVAGARAKRLSLPLPSPRHATLPCAGEPSPLSHQDYGIFRRDAFFFRAFAILYREAFSRSDKAILWILWLWL